jgi:hypothetical protein
MPEQRDVYRCVGADRPEALPFTDEVARGGERRPDLVAPRPVAHGVEYLRLLPQGVGRRPRNPHASSSCGSPVSGARASQCAVRTS